MLDRETADLVSALLRDICECQGIRPDQLTVHSDNGSAVKGEAMQRLGVAHARSRPAVSSDNSCAESAFRTLKYRLEMPLRLFESLLAARRWVTELAHGYNQEHCHSAIGFVTPAQRHAALDRALLEPRAWVCALAHQRYPQGWSAMPRPWAHVDTVPPTPTPQQQRI